MSEQVSPSNESARSDDESSSAFQNFLLAEYNNIAQAHFNTVDSLSNFIKHYIAIASIPFAAAVFLFNSEGVDAAGIANFIRNHPLTVPLFLSLISLIGLFVLAYVVNIRFDAILYARTVNGIRKHFYDRSGLTFADELHIRALPRTTNLPNYIEPQYFGYVVLTFTLVGTAYFAAGWYFYWVQQEWAAGWFVLLLTSFAALHWLLYAKLAEHRERTYLQKQIIGVDVDGVLNAHRQQFSAVLKSRTGKEIAPDAITQIPVHEIPGGPVTEGDANAVFNWPEYWTYMPPVQSDIGDLVNKLRNVLGYRVWIFTYRPWPEPSMFPNRKLYWSAWNKTSWWSYATRFAHGLDVWMENHGVPALVRGRLIRSITRRWLGERKISYDKLVIEGGNTSTADARMLTRNRFLFAKKYEFRAFVEDDLTKARKLASICQVVFLVDHPYNQCSPSSLPSNLVRVKSWHDIYRFLRQVF